MSFNIPQEKNDIVIRISSSGIELYKCIGFNYEEQYILLFRIDLKNAEKKKEEDL